jgi:ABC-type arginine/histidine transport system permease subunit
MKLFIEIMEWLMAGVAVVAALVAMSAVLGGVLGFCFATARFYFLLWG